MPAKKLVEEFPFDPATFNWDEFKKRLTAEIDADDDLSTTKITSLEGERDTLKSSENTLKVKLFDATVLKQGAPVAPTDSPTAGAGQNGTATVPESDIFKKVE